MLVWLCACTCVYVYNVLRVFVKINNKNGSLKKIEDDSQLVTTVLKC